MQTSKQEEAGGSPSAIPPQIAQTGPNIHWIGPPAYVHNDIPHYRAASVAGVQISIGDFVYLKPSDPTVPLYIGRIDDLLISNEVPSATITWFYRPQELNLDTPLPVFDNEVFAADESETHPLDSVAGKCVVVPPGTQTIEASQQGMDAYVCSRKYISTEGRVIPFADEQLGNEARPFVLVNGRILARPAAGSFMKQQRAAAVPSAAEPARKQPSPRGAANKRRKREKTPSRPSSVSLGRNGGLQFPSTAAPAAAPAGATTAAPSASVSQGGKEPSDKSGGGGGSGGGVSGTPRGGPPPSPRARKEHHGRWSTDRYEAAQRFLIHILRLMGATSPDVSVLRPTLRDEARKVIGDTGLLDHLLKHLADQVVSPEGERLRRRHNREGHMEYWLQNPAAMEEEEKMMEQELTALTSELREVREARHALQTVRTEAAQAIQAVSGLKEHPTEAAAGLAGLQTPMELAARIDAVEQANVNLQRRLFDAESLAASGMEELRKELSQAGHVLGEHIGSFQKAVEELSQRCRELEFKSAVGAEDAAGRFEAVSAALNQAVGVTNVFRQEMAQRDVIIGYLQREMAGLRQALALAMAPFSAAASQQQQQRTLPGMTTAGQPPSLRPAEMSTTPHSSLPLPVQQQQEQHQQQQQAQQPNTSGAPLSSIAAMPATAPVPAALGDKDGIVGAAVPVSYQPLTPLKPAGTAFPSSNGGVPAAGAGGTAPVSTAPGVEAYNAKDEEMPLQMPSQPLDPETLRLAASGAGFAPGSAPPQS